MDSLDGLRTIRALTSGEDAYFDALDESLGAEGAPGPDGASYAAWIALHRLSAFVEPAVLGAAGRGRLPPALVADLEAGAEKRRLRHDEVVAETLEAMEAFEAAGLPCLLLKGLYLGTRFYGDVRRRYQRDVDVLVRVADREAAFAALEARGYVREPGVLDEGAVRWGLRRGYADVDVHWNLRRRARRRFDEEELWRDPTRFAVAGRTLATMGEEPTLTFLLLAVCGDLRRGACQGRHLLDLLLVLRALAPTLDVEGFLDRRRRQGVEAPCANVLAVLVRLFDLGEEFPAVVRALDRRRRLLHVVDAVEARDLLDRPRRSPENERWFRRAYPYDAWNAWGRRLSVDLPYALSRLRVLPRFGPGSTSPRRSDA